VLNILCLTIFFKRRGKERKKICIFVVCCSQPAKPEGLSYSQQHWVGNLERLIFINSSECICFFSLPQESFTYLSVFIPSAANYPFLVCSQVSHQISQCIIPMKTRGKKRNKSCVVHTTIQYFSSTLHQWCCSEDIVTQIFLTAWLQQPSNPRQRLWRPKKPQFLKKSRTQTTSAFLYWINKQFPKICNLINANLCEVNCSAKK